MKSFILNILTFFLHLLPIKHNKIMLMSWYGKQYGCNPKYISQKMQEMHPDWEIVWALTNPNTHNIPGVKKVRYHSLKFFYDLYTCKVFITNCRMPLFYKKRKGQIYLQTWHSVLRLKQIEKDIEKMLPPHYAEMAKHDGHQIDYLLSGCKKSTEIFERCFWNDGEIVELGSPRNDILLSLTETERDNLKDKIGIEKGKFVVLYAPTFRKSHDTSVYDIDFGKLKDTIEASLGKECIVLLRLHPNLHNQSQQFIEKFPSLIDTTNYEDIQELLAITDLLITDYSGLMFDFLLTEKPILLYVPDLQEFLTKDTLLYFNLDELPMLKCNNQDELLKNARDILSYYSTNKEKINKFNHTLGFFNKTNGAESIVKFLESKMS